MAIYRGVKQRTESGGFPVWRDNVEMQPGPSLKLADHSPDGFNWGYAGSGPAQLALALLLDVSLHREKSLRHYQDFKDQIVARLGPNWHIDGRAIQTWLDKAEVKEAAKDN